MLEMAVLTNNYRATNRTVADSAPHTNLDPTNDLTLVINFSQDIGFQIGVKDNAIGL